MRLITAYTYIPLYTELGQPNKFQRIKLHAEISLSSTVKVNSEIRISINGIVWSCLKNTCMKEWTLAPNDKKKVNSRNGRRRMKIIKRKGKLKFILKCAWRRLLRQMGELQAGCGVTHTHTQPHIHSRMCNFICMHMCVHENKVDHCRWLNTINFMPLASSSSEPNNHKKRQRY